MLPSYKFVAIALAIALTACAGARRAQAQELKASVIPSDNAAPPDRNSPETKTTRSTVSMDQDSATSINHHHYDSEAERAQDDLLITQVKSALAEDGISSGYPVQVDADHGTVTLSGVVASAADVEAAAEDAAGVHGVVGVRNLLRPH
jgi:hypothetical protein